MSGTDWWGVFYSWLPIIAMIGFWIFIMKKVTGRMSRQPELIERAFQHYDRVEALLERIAAASERRPPQG